MSAPTPPPVRWPSGWQWPRVQQRLLYVGVGFAAAMILGAVNNSLPVIIVSALISFLCLAVWFESRARYRSSQLVNAVTLTEATVPPPDSWVHFFRERRRSLGLLMTMFLLGVGFIGVGVLSWVMTPQSSVVLVRIVGTIIGLIGILFVFGGARGIIGRKRLSSFGERPLGIALGKNALMFVTVTGATYLPWGEILRVEAEQLDRATKSDQNPGAMWLNLTVRRADGSTATMPIAPMASEVHPWVTYAAVSMAAADERFRASLGTSRAQAVFDAWHLYATNPKAARS